MDHRICLPGLLCLAMFFPLSSQAQDSATSATSEPVQTLGDVTELYAPGTINTTEVAARALDDVRRQRASVAARFAEDEAMCYEKFFVTSCMDAAKDRQRLALKQLNAIEVEANAYNRRARVEERDQALRDRQAKQEAKIAEQGGMPDSENTRKAPATSQDIADVENRSRQMSTAPNADPSQNFNTARAARQKEEMAKEKAKEHAEAKKREDNIRAYEKKQQRSLERQREIAAKKQEKEGTRAADRP